MGTTFTARHVDTCLSDYLQDSYSRPGQTLCLASLGGERDLTVDDLYDSIDWDSGIPDAANLEEDIRAALAEAIADVDTRYIDENGNRCDETPDDRDSEEPYLYVVLEWDPTVIKMQLVVDVEYLANGTDAHDLKLVLENLVSFAVSDSGLVGGTDADLVSWGATATEVK